MATPMQIVSVPPTAISVLPKNYLEYVSSASGGDTAQLAMQCYEGLGAEKSLSSRRLALATYVATQIPKLKKTAQTAMKWQLSCGTAPSPLSLNILYMRGMNITSDYKLEPGDYFMRPAMIASAMVINDHVDLYKLDASKTGSKHGKYLLMPLARMAMTDDNIVKLAYEMQLDDTAIVSKMNVACCPGAGAIAGGDIDMIGAMLINQWSHTAAPENKKIVRANLGKAMGQATEKGSSYNPTKIAAYLSYMGGKAEEWKDTTIQEILRDGWDVKKRRGYANADARTTGIQKIRKEEFGMEEDGKGSSDSTSV